MYRNSGSPADNDLLGNIEFEGRNDNSQDVVYGRLFSRISDASDGSEDGIMRFDIMKAGSLSDVLTINSDEIIVNDGSYDYDFRVESNDYTHALFVQGSDGNVGIGTTSPATKLAVSGGYISQTDGTRTLYLGSDGTGGLFGTTTDHYLRFITNNSERMRIDSSGNLGIGTTNPAQPFVVAEGTNQHGVEIAPGSLSYIQAYDRATSDYGDLKIDAQTIQFGTDNGTERMRIDSSGNAIFTKSGGAYLQLKDASAVRGAINVGTSDGLIFTTGSSFTERMRIDSSGNLLVGRTSASFGSATGLVIRPNNDSYIITNGTPALTLRRNSSNGDIMQFYRDGTQVGYISASTTGTSYQSGSDRRLKENIADADDAGSKIDAIQVRKFDWIADGSHQDYGMIAQELQTVAPEAVGGDPDSDKMMGVDYSKLVPMLVKEIQSLRARVQQLENN